MNNNHRLADINANYFCYYREFVSLSTPYDIVIRLCDLVVDTEIVNPIILTCMTQFKGTEYIQCFKSIHVHIVRYFKSVILALSRQIMFTYLYSIKPDYLSKSLRCSK